jgi:hypothetical protein
MSVGSSVSVIRFLVQQIGVVGVDEERVLRENLGHRLLRFERRPAVRLGRGRGVMRDR